MVSAKRCWVALLLVALLLAVGSAAWIYYGHPSPKVPARARQVMAIGLEDWTAILHSEE